MNDINSYFIPFRVFQSRKERRGYFLFSIFMFYKNAFLIIRLLQSKRILSCYIN